MKDTWKDYFTFNKKQRNGILVLLSLIAVLLIYLSIADYFPVSNTKVEWSTLKKEIGETGARTVTSNQKNNSSPLFTDINSADTALLMKLPKMTSYCARMIVGYRKKLGGYYSPKQLHEVWGMDSAMFIALSGKVCADTTSIRKIDINTADVKQLAYHPYIKYYLAKAIVNYRDQHGRFASLAALHKMAAIDDSTYNKIVPYLTIRQK